MSSATRIKAVLVTLALLCSAWAWADELPFTPEQLNHWAYKKVQKPAVPAVKNRAWAKSPVDAFVLAKLEEKGLAPAARADKVTLLRRATFDLTGLPPTPEEVSAFLADKSPRAFEKVVDRLLASPHYGEKWARHWLDLARYAESDGFKADDTRPHIWRYRDYVIKSFNDDKPYDRFLMEQIAGDELWPDDPDAVIATAFNRHYADESNARNLMQRRQEILNDVTDTVGAVFTGLFAFPFFWLLDTANPVLLVLAVVTPLAFGHAAMYGPQASFFSELFGTRVRYSGASLGYQLASVLAGGLSPLIATSLLKRTGSYELIALLIIGMAVITTVSVYLAVETAHKDIHAETG